MNTETRILSMSGDWSASCECKSSEQLQIKGLLHQNEESFRDLFDEAPIAYVIGGRDWRIIQANRTPASSASPRSSASMTISGARRPLSRQHCTVLGLPDTSPGRRARYRFARSGNSWTRR